MEQAARTSRTRMKMVVHTNHKYISQHRRFVLLLSPPSPSSPQLRSASSALEEAKEPLF